MPETKQNLGKRLTACFSKEPDPGDVQLIAGPSLDPYNGSAKYMPVIFVENESDPLSPIEINGDRQ